MKITKLLPVIIILLICIIVFTDIYENFVGCYSIHTGKKINDGKDCESNYCYCFNGTVSDDSICIGGTTEHCNSCKDGYIRIDNKCLLQPRTKYTHIQDIDCSIGYYKSGGFCEPCTRCEDFGEVQISDCTITNDTQCSESTTPVYVCGHSHSGRFGIGFKNNRDYFNLENVVHSKHIIDISLSSDAAMFLTNLGEVYTCGHWAQCCNLKKPWYSGMDNNYIITPEKITYFDTQKIRITQISKSNLHALFLSDTGRVYYCGTNQYGANGKPDRQISNIHTPYLLHYFNNKKNIEYILTNSANASIVIADGVVYYSGSNIMNYNKSNPGYIYSFTPLTFSSLQGIKIKKAYSHNPSSFQPSPRAMFITYSGEVYAYGYHRDILRGPLGLGDYYVTNDGPEILPFSQEHPIKEIAMGFNYTLFLTETGKVWGCGDSYYGQLGLGVSKKDNPNAIPVQLNFFNNFTIIKIAAGKFHSLFLTDTGIVYGCGQNDKGQLGFTNTGSGNYYYEPVEIEITNNISNIFTNDSKYSMFIGNIIE